jgi:hypothetical protein
MCIFINALNSRIQGSLKLPTSEVIRHANFFQDICIVIQCYYYH